MSDKLIDLSEEAFFEEVLPLAAEVVSDLLKKDYCGCLSKLTNQEIRSIYFYTTESDEFSYKRINSAILDKSTDLSKEWQIKAIDSALEKLPSYVGACYREEDENGRVKTAVEQALRIVEDESIDISTRAHSILRKEFGFFVSVTMANYSLSNNRKPIKIKVLAKSKAKKIACASALPDEKECLFQRDAVFLITEVHGNELGFFVTLAEV